MEEKNQQEIMAIVRQVELFENAFNKAKENGGMWLDNDGRKAPKLYLKPLQIQRWSQSTETISEAFADFCFQCHHIGNAQRPEWIQNKSIYAFF